MPDPKIAYDWARVPCPTCGSGIDERCRTLTTNRTTDAHERRHMEAAWVLTQQGRRTAHA